MPLKINVGISRKVGEPNFGSRGGNVQFEAEVEATLLREPDELHKRIRYLFQLAEEALAKQLEVSTGAVVDACGKQPGPPPPASARQLALIQRLAAQSESDLEALLTDVFDTDALEHLSRIEASRMIDILQSECAVRDVVRHAPA